MRKKTGIMFFTAVAIVLLICGCQKNDRAGSVKIYYAAIEDGDYYEG